MAGQRSPAAVVDARGLGRTFSSGDAAVAALGNITLHVAEGEFVAVLGASGAGKSTLLHLIGGLDRPTAGWVAIGGRNLAAFNEDQLTVFRRQRLGFVFQSFNLLPSLTVAENIAIPFIIAGRTSQDDLDRIQDLVELFGLRGREQRQASGLSTGEQQRVALARAFVTDPSLIVADEPTGNLDSTTGLEVLQLLWESCDNFKQTILLATHHPRIAVFADRVLVLSDGRLVDEIVLGRRDNHSDPRPIIDRLQALGL